MPTEIVTNPLRVAVIGAGYIGYPLVLTLASAGHDVIAVDTDEAVVSDINAHRGRSNEPDIAALASDPAVQQQIAASDAPQPADVFVIAVPTPLVQSSRRADLSMVEAAVVSIVPYLVAGNLVIIESTVPPGTTSGIIKGLLAESGLEVGTELLLAHCPERLHPGSTIDELHNNDRLLGGVSPSSAEAARSLYSTFVRASLVETDATTAELCKLLENTHRDINIALANQMADIAGSFGADPAEVLRLASAHPRVSYLEPGIGVGGHCIPVDPWFLHSEAPTSPSLIEAARTINDTKPLVVARRIADQLDAADAPSIVLIGAAYKANVSDTREAPALQVKATLTEMGFDVTTYDPHVYPDSPSLLSLAEGASMIAILVPHAVALDTIYQEYDALTKSMHEPLIVDFSSGFPSPIARADFPYSLD